jgi:uncharacterized pyridoxamine 5'-phosphate oxidase family protein
MVWQDALKTGQELILSTSSKDGKPHAIYVIGMGLVDNKILIGLCQTNISLKNLQENPVTCVVAKHDGEYYRMTGKATLYDSGNYYDLVVERSGPDSREVKYALAVDVEEVYDLDKVKKLV